MNDATVTEFAEHLMDRIGFEPTAKALETAVMEIVHETENSDWAYSQDYDDTWVVALFEAVYEYINDDLTTISFLRGPVLYRIEQFIDPENVLSV